jgi:hypothetical protein
MKGKMEKAGQDDTDDFYRRASLTYGVARKSVLWLKVRKDRLMAVEDSAFPFWKNHNWAPITQPQEVQ